ncbi:S41 family peptidase [Salmonirosea aquatica]|uniref:Tricorn protease homolog n=1 Tax=Salmonirosea aquatica TaxID=2654236 RepID=A0A7C9BE03_9BACT|nr:protease [Cytophagaceae bacterium SJW1-29]
MKIFYTFVFPLTFLFSQTLHAQGTRLLRQPTISAKSIVFVYADDLWLVDREGGDARRLTTNIGSESNPHFSPDGQTLAFSAEYGGNTDVYVMSLSGGEPRRLTWHPGEDAVQGWTPDGKSVLFRSGREGYPTALTKFWTVSATEGTFPQALVVPQAHAGQLSPDGTQVAYQSIAFWDSEWRNYRGGQAQPIWIMNLKDHSVKMTPQPDRERHTDPVWYKNTIYFLSERDYANNVWSFDPATNALKQITFHRDFDVKSLDAGPDRIVYEQGGYLHLLDPATGKARQLDIRVQGDFNYAMPRWEDVKASELANVSLSPTGQRMLFEYRGDIFTAPKENGTWRNITQTSGAADRSPIWSPDGQQIAWFSDRSGEYQLMVTDQAGMTPPKAIDLPNPTFFFRPDWSPDGKYIAYTDTDYNLWYVNLASGKAKKVDTERYAHPNRSMNPKWSPDSKWIAYARLLDNHLKVIKAHNIDTDETLQLTDGMSDAIAPVWDESGKYLYFLASTDFGLNTAWLDMTSYEHPITRGLYAIVLAKGVPSPMLPKSDEEKLKPEEKEDGKAGSTVGAKKDDKKKKDEPAPKKIKIDKEDIDQRIVSLGVPLKNYVELLPGPEGTVFYIEDAQGEPTQKLHKFTFEDQKSKEFLSGMQEAVVSHDRKQLLYNTKGTWSIVPTAGEKAKAGEGKVNLASIKMKIEPQPEYEQIFREGWRYQRDFLYVNNTHGAPWDSVYNWYQPWVQHVRHRTDLNYIVDILGGEVAVGHSFTSGGDLPKVDNVPIGLLGADVVADGNRYRITKIFTGENWNPGLKSPLSGPGIDVREGDYILEVNGRPVTTAENFFSYFEGLADRQIKVRVNQKADTSGSRLATVVPIANETQLRLRGWVEGNRRKVSELSEGKLAYVWLPNTGGGGYEYFNRYYFAQQDKKGAIIDERNNGGGSAADYIVDVLGRKLQGYFNSNAGDHKPFTTPIAGLWGPKVMIINERAGSGGDLMPYLFRQAKVGPLVGTRTWGGLVGTWDTPRFIDGGRMVAPRGGFYDLNGNWAVEGEGIAPDIEVMQNPADVIAGRDPQLIKAVEEAMRLLKTEEVVLKPEPPAPNKYRRPEGQK